jgi:hypothetical protein
MFWDAFLNPARELLSNDISEWIVAALFTAFVVTKLGSIAFGSFEGRQELHFGIALFLVLFGAFYLP